MPFPAEQLTVYRLEFLCPRNRIVMIAITQSASQLSLIESAFIHYKRSARFCQLSHGIRYRSAMVYHGAAYRRKPPNVLFGGFHYYFLIGIQCPILILNHAGTPDRFTSDTLPCPSRGSQHGGSCRCRRSSGAPQRTRQHADTYTARCPS